ncbi:hypothetical protein EXIGLDRAFT_109082 [Exidia glandulosa HHB12029]|uniref:Uncharacterized protein n=1 Tax=Exidia glandulosa HHB12029 TaxID=1314781 RepID=A0A165GPU1_EXIGL|nr:hypothetical protein EXIGLDRAFT_109082 [Exidia glandulosa HHB12029]
MLIPRCSCNPDATDCSCSGLFCTREVRQRVRGGRDARLKTLDSGSRHGVISGTRHHVSMEEVSIGITAAMLVDKEYNRVPPVGD